MADTGTASSAGAGSDREGSAALSEWEMQRMQIIRSLVFSDLEWEVKKKSEMIDGATLLAHIEENLCQEAEHPRQQAREFFTLLLLDGILVDANKKVTAPVISEASKYQVEDLKWALSRETLDALDETRFPDIVKEIRHPRRGIKMQERRVGLSKKPTFLGASLVSWLVVNYVLTVEQARDVAQLMTSERLVQAVKKKKSLIFCNDMTVYRFVKGYDRVVIRRGSLSERGYYTETEEEAVRGLQAPVPEVTDVQQAQIDRDALPRGVAFVGADVWGREHVFPPLTRVLRVSRKAITYSYETFVPGRLTSDPLRFELSDFSLPDDKLAQFQSERNFTAVDIISHVTDTRIDTNTSDSALDENETVLVNASASDTDDDDDDDEVFLDDDDDLYSVVDASAVAEVAQAVTVADTSLRMRQLERDDVLSSSIYVLCFNVHYAESFHVLRGAVEALVAHKSEENIPIVLVGVARIGYQRRVTTTEIEVAAGLLGCHYVEVPTSATPEENLDVILSACLEREGAVVVRNTPLVSPFVPRGESYHYGVGNISDNGASDFGYVQEQRPSRASRRMSVAVNAGVTSAGMPTLYRASLDQIVSHLLAKPWYDAAFVSEMILMSRYFSTAIEFQRLLVERAVAALADLGGVGFEAFEADVGARTMERRAVVIRMIKILYRWLDLAGEDFEEPNFHRAALLFADKVADVAGGQVHALGAHMKRILLTAAAKAAAEGTSLRSSIILGNVDPLAAAEAEAAEARGGTPEDPTPLDFAFRDVDDVTFAMQLALKGQELFAALSHREVYADALAKGTARDAPTIVALASQFNLIARFVATELLKTCVLADRVEVLERWIRIAYALFEIKCLAGCMAVLAGLSHAAIRRLKRTWARVGKNHLRRYKAVSDAVSVKRNCAAQRLILPTIASACVPYLGMFLGDITFLNDGNESILGGLIHVQKFSKLAQVYLDIKRYQDIRYDFPPLPAYSRFLDNLGAWNETALYIQSLDLEPVEGTLMKKIRTELGQNAGLSRLYDLVLVLQEENERLRAAANAQRSETAQRGVVPDVADALEELDALGVFGSNRGDI